MRFAFLSLLLGLAPLGHALAQPALVTPFSKLPEASDTRGDEVLRDEAGRPVSHPLLGGLLPEFSGALFDGTPFSTDQLKGRWTILVAWGVWCHDSRNDFGNILATAAAAHADPDLQFYAVHVPQSAERLDQRFGKHGSVEAFLASEETQIKLNQMPEAYLALFQTGEVPVPVIMDDTAELRELLSIQWTPSYLLISPDLEIAGFRTDVYSDEEGELERFIAEARAVVTRRGEAPVER